MSRDRSGPRDRVLAAIEIPALGIWLGALTGFAFVTAPLAFRLIAPLDVVRFAALVAGTLAVLTKWSYVLGGLACAVALVRGAYVRAALVALAVAAAYFHQHVIVQRMLAIPDLASPAYRALHQRSTEVFGAVVLLALVALVLAALQTGGRPSRSV